MGRAKSVQIDGRTVTVQPDTKVQEVKSAVGAATDDVATFLHNGEVIALSDRDNLYQQVPDDANVSFQPAEGTVFG
jgi:hypothetical protein